MSNIVDQVLSADPFGSLITSSPISVMNYKPTWGISANRYDTTTTGTGAAVTETGGEFRLSSGTTTSNVAQIQTLERGQYQAGTLARFGIGVRIPTAPTSTQEIQIGYFDNDNGFFFGQDATGVYVARRSATTDTKVYQPSWNLDHVDGAGDTNNPSGLTLDLSVGVICQCRFTWYGFGVIQFEFVLYDSTNEIFETVPVHQIKVDSSLSIVDPNQPLRFRVANGASSTTNLDFYVAGHQFEYFHGSSVPKRRVVPELLTNYTTATSTDWQPLIAVRKKSTHGTSGRTNSVKARVTGYEISADNEMEVRLTYGGATSNLSWAAPTGWTAAESAIETKVTGGTALTTSSDGFPTSYDFVNSTRTSLAGVSEATELALGTDKEVILWIRRITATGAMIVKHAHVNVEEEW